jgi:hypothetical protein
MKQMIVVEVSPVELEKATVSGILGLKQEELKQKPIPKREECSSDDEYKILLTEYMLDAVKFAEQTKKEVFVQDLEKYNSFLSRKFESDRQLEELRKQHFSEIDRNTRRKGQILLAEVITTLLLPEYFPIIIGVGLVQMISSNTSIQFHLKELKNEEQAEEMIRNIQIELADLSFKLREDYHKSKQEFGLLRQRALQGENILEDALYMISPERLSLPRVDVKIEENTNDKGEKPKVIHLINLSNKKEVTL